MAKMNIAPSDRPRVKSECLRLLATLRLAPARMQLISGLPLCSTGGTPFGFASRLRRETRLQRWTHRTQVALFIDTYLRLTAQEEEIFRATELRPKNNHSFIENFGRNGNGNTSNFR